MVMRDWPWPTDRLYRRDIASKAGTKGAVLPARALCATRPITAAETPMCKIAQAAVLYTDAAVYDDAGTLPRTTATGQKA
jgi:hypothetical protein